MQHQLTSARVSHGLCCGPGYSSTVLEALDYPNGLTPGGRKIEVSPLSSHPEAIGAPLHDREPCCDSKLVAY